MDDEDPEAYVGACVDALQEAAAAWYARKWLAARGLLDRTVRAYMLGFDAHRNAITIPYLNALGEVRSFRWRNLQREPKYLQPKGVGLHLFHVKASRKPMVWLTEGEFDAMILDQCGFPSVGIPGANSFKPEWAYLFAYCDQVTVVFDPDEAGQEAAAKVTRILGPYVTKLRMVRLPQGKDVTDLYLEDKAELLSRVS